MEKDEILENMFEMAILFNKTSDFYDKGKYYPCVEEITDNIYGIYYQTYDSPFGDTWEAAIIKIKDGLTVLKKFSDDNRFYHKNFFKEELDKIPYGDIKK